MACDVNMAVESPHLHHEDATSVVKIEGLGGARGWWVVSLPPRQTPCAVPKAKLFAGGVLFSFMVSASAASDLGTCKEGVHLFLRRGHDHCPRFLAFCPMCSHFFLKSNPPPQPHFTFPHVSLAVGPELLQMCLMRRWFLAEELNW